MNPITFTTAGKLQIGVNTLIREVTKLNEEPGADNDVLNLTTVFIAGLVREVRKLEGDE